MNHLTEIRALVSLSRKDKIKARAILKHFYHGIKDMDLFLVAQKMEHDKILIVSNPSDTGNAIQHALKSFTDKSYKKLGRRTIW